MTLNTSIEEIALKDVPFANDVLTRLDTRQIEFGATRVGSVDLSKVIGTTHPDYHGKTWGELKPTSRASQGYSTDNVDINFHRLKRSFSIIRCLERNPEYYISDETKEHWSFYEIEDRYYISSGNHRTIIGRFFLFINRKNELVHGVEITAAKFIEPPEKKREPENALCRILAWFRT